MTPIPPTERERCLTCDHDEAGGGVRPLVEALEDIRKYCSGRFFESLSGLKAYARRRTDDALAAYRALSRTEGRAGDGEGERG